MDSLGERIKIAAATVGGLDGLAPKLTNVSRRTLSDWANDKTEPRASTLVEIAKTTGTSISWLVAGEEEAGPGFNHNDGAQVLPARIDPQRLMAAIEAVEEGLSGRQVPAPVKAELTIAAYDLLTEATAENRARVIRLVKGG